jgi:molecular chaperone GrpE (heat shock protein)
MNDRRARKRGRRHVKLGGLLLRHGVGLPFDPHRQEAVSLGQDPGKPEHIVLKVILRGYCRGDRIFRPAKVIVNASASAPAADSSF